VQDHQVAKYREPDAPDIGWWNRAVAPGVPESAPPPLQIREDLRLQAIRACRAGLGTERLPGFAKVGLPITVKELGLEAGFDDLIGAMRVDKKARGSVLRFLVLHDVADPRILTGPTEEQLRDAYAVVGG
jgi:hypothetical protein